MLAPIASLALAALLLLSAGPGRAAESQVFLRTDCGTLSAPPCFETTGALTTWLWTTRSPLPSAGDEVLVLVEPGSYDPIVCNGQGYVTLRGAGRTKTTFAGTGAGLSATSCTDLQLQELTLDDVSWVDSTGGLFEGVDVTSGFAASCTTGSTDTSWFSSRIVVEADAAVNLGFSASCGTHEFKGGEIQVLGSTNTPATSRINSVSLTGGSLTLVASVVRAGVGTAPATTAFADASPSPGLGGVFVDGASLKMHGGIINTSAGGNTDTGTNATAIQAANGGTVTAAGTAYNVKKGAGLAYRLRDVTSDSTIDAPFLWPSGTQVPDVISLDGQDLFVETDLGGSANESHLLIYNPAFCTASSWLDAITKTCRP